MSLKHKKRLLTHLRHQTYVPTNIDQLAEDLGVAPEERGDFEAAVAELEAAGQVVYGDNNFVTLPPLGKTLIGTFKRNPKGFGFIIPRDPISHGDLFVPAPDTMDALSGDIVKAEVVKARRRPDDNRSPYTGVIVEILERKKANFTGELRKRGGQWLVFPDGKTLTDAVVVRDAESKNAKEGDKVVFELLHYPEGQMLGEGVITRVLGDAGRPDVETAAVIEAYNLPGEFPEACMEQARELSAMFNAEMKEAIEEGKGWDPAKRLDLRDTFVLTIDPPDSKDYDDALSIETTENGWRLSVHIADVAYFVEQGSPLDLEAAERGNSCYLPRLVIPMLPEQLSNGICSLQERVPRYCKTAFIEYNKTARVTGMGFASTVINSSKRLTYIEAQALIDGDVAKAREHAKTEPNYTDELRWALRELNTLSKAIRERRRRFGMIHLDLPEVDLVFDENGHVVDAQPEDKSYTHTLIEMLMVEANEAVARLFEEMNVPLLRRTHPEPVPGQSEGLREFVKVAGYRIPKSPTLEDLQKLLDATAGTAAAPAVHMAVLRSLTRAEYSPALVGHFALASDAYAHFTSPIRRYADLTVHRALGEYLRMTRNGQDRPGSEEEARKLGKELKQSPLCPDEATLVLIGQRCNQTEQNAEGAEHELRAFLVLQLLEKHIGEDFAGMVTGVTSNGVFVQLEKYLADGLVKADTLVPQGLKPGQWPQWSIDKRSGALVERHTGRSYNIGDKVTVTVSEVDLARRQMELVISDTASRDMGKSKKVTDKLRLGDGVGGGLGHVESFERRTGADKRAARSKGRERNKSDFRGKRKDKGKGF